MKRKLSLFFLTAVLLLSGMGLILTGCANNEGKVFSKNWATKMLNKELSEEDVVINFKSLNIYDTYYYSDYVRNYTKEYEKVPFKTNLKYSKIFSKDLKKYSGKTIGYFTGQVDVCKPKFGTQFGRKIYGCSYTFIFHPSNDYIKLMKDLTDNGRLKRPVNLPPYIRKKYTTKHAGIAFAKDKKSGIWKVVAFNFEPYGSPAYK